MKAVLTVVPVFILIGAGYFLHRKQWLSSQTIKDNSLFLYWFAMPATLLRGILGADISVVQNISFLAAVWLPYLITPVLIWKTMRGRDTNARFASLMLSAARGNNFYVGLPIVSLAMGERGVEAGTLILTFALVFMQLISIGGSQLALFGAMSWKTVKSTCIQLFKNPLFLACFFGLVFVFSGFNRLPPWINDTLGILSNLSTGLALIVIGAEIRLQNFFNTIASVWKVVLFKLFVFPAVTYVVFVCFGLSRDLVQAGVLLAAMPVAVNTSIIAQEMGMDSAHCVMGIAVTMIFSLFTLPLLISMLGLV